MGNSASNKEDEERERRKMLGPFSEKEYKNLQFAFSGIITSQTLEQVQERENQQDGKKRLKDRKKVSDKNVTVPIQDVVQFLQLAGIIDSDKSEIIVSKLLDFHPGVSAVSFDDLKEGLAILLKGTTSEVRFRLYSAGVATDFETIFSLIHVIGDVLRGNKLCEGTNGSTTKVGHIVSGLKYYAAENADSDHQYPQVGFQVFNRWCEIEVPSLSKDLQGWFHKRLLGAGKLKSSCSVAPSIIQESVLKPEVVYALSCSSSVFNGEKPWQRLFTTRTQGMSFELLSESIIGYGGPTLLVIRDTLGNIFGGYSTSTWKEDTKFYGDSNCVLYALWPRFNVFRARISNSQDSNNYQYLNTKSRTKDHGIGFGGRDGALRLWIDGNIECCRARPLDFTFEKGSLRTRFLDSDSFDSDKDMFKVDTIEAWGLGEEAALAEQERFRKENADLIYDRRKVDKKQFANSDFDKEFLLGKTFASQMERQER